MKPVLNCKFGSLSESDLEKLGKRQAALFVRISHQGVANVDSWDEAAQSMPNFFVVASFAGSALDAFSIVLENVATPNYFFCLLTKNETLYRFWLQFTTPLTKAN
jgi:hypothetical protein